MTFVLCFSLVGQEVSARDYSNKKDLQYYEIDGNIYGFEQILGNKGEKIKTNVYLGNDLTEEVVIDFNNGKITSNGKEVGFVEEVLEEISVPKVKKNEIKAGNDILKPYVISPPGDFGGGIKNYIRTYKTGFSEATRVTIVAVVSLLAKTVFTLIAARLGINTTNPYLNTAIGTFITSHINNLIPNKSYYVKVYDTGTVQINGFGYRRALLEFYSTSSCISSSYIGCEWADGYIAP